MPSLGGRQFRLSATRFLVISQVMFCVLVQQASAGCANFRKTHTYELAISQTHFHVGVLAHHVVRHAVDPLPYPGFVCVGHPHPPRTSITRHPLLWDSVFLTGLLVESIIFFGAIRVIRFAGAARFVRLSMQSCRLRACMLKNALASDICESCGSSKLGDTSFRCKGFFL